MSIFSIGAIVRRAYPAGMDKHLFISKKRRRSNVQRRIKSAQFQHYFFHLVIKIKIQNCPTWDFAGQIGSSSSHLLLLNSPKLLGNGKTGAPRTVSWSR
jgi:hypothetical protein